MGAPSVERKKGPWWLPPKRHLKRELIPRGNETPIGRMNHEDDDEEVGNVGLLHPRVDAHWHVQDSEVTTHLYRRVRGSRLSFFPERVVDTTQSERTRRIEMPQADQIVSDDFRRHHYIAMLPALAMVQANAEAWWAARRGTALTPSPPVHFTRMKGSAVGALLVGGLIALIWPAQLEAQEPTGRIAGVVRDATTQGPVEGATVSLSNGAAQSTDVDGRYRFEDVAVGTVLIEIRRIGYQVLLEPDILVRSDRTIVLAHALRIAAIQLEGITVPSATYFDRDATVSAAPHGLSGEEIRRSAGSIGDVLRLAQTLPGVALTNDTRNDLVVRGGSPAENLTLVDNIEVPSLNHFSSQNTSGGPVSMLNTDFISDTRFSSGGFAARFGDRLSSVLEIDMREGSRDRNQFAIDMGTSGGGFIGEGPLSESGSWLLSLRRSYLELLADAIGLTAVPEFWNLNAKVAYDLGQRDRVWGIAIGGIDHIRIDVDANDLDDPSLENVEFNGWRTIVGVNWRHVFDWGFGTLTLSDARSSNEIESRDARIGNQLVFDQDDRDGVITTKYDVSAALSSDDQLRIGAELRYKRGIYDLDVPLGAESPFVEQAVRVNPIQLSTTVTSADVGAYAEYSRRLGRRFDGNAGVRLDLYDFIDETRVGGQVRLVFHASSNVDIAAAGGVYHQQPPLVFLAAVPANRALDPIRAQHLIASVLAYPREDIRIVVEGYLKYYDDYPVSTQFPELTLANTGADYGISQLLFPMTSVGDGRARGVEASVQKKYASGWYGQVSYSLSDSDHAALDGVRRPAAFDIRHLLTVWGGTTVGNWEISAKYAFTSGRPYTPFLLLPSRAQNRGIFDLARVNAERSPVFQRIDIRIERRFIFNGWSLFAFADVLNVTNRKNEQQYIWNEKTLEPDWLDQFATVPNLGFTLKF